MGFAVLRAAPLLFILLPLLAGCAGSKGVELLSPPKEDEIPYVERPAEQIYAEATEALNERRWDRAAALFKEVERQHPYSAESPRAQVMAGFAHYQDLDYDEAILALDRFIKLYPAHERADYAYYLRALSYYEQITDVGRDQANTREAQEALQEVIKRFPNSDYARDARLKYDLTQDHLAGKEMEIGRFYLDQRQYNAALRRFKTVTDQYQTTTHVPEALHRLTEVYVALGLVDEAKKTAALLGYNYPGSEWYADSYALLTAEGFQPERPDEGLLARLGL